MVTYRVDIVIPARDEAVLLPRALASVRRAVRYASRMLVSPPPEARPAPRSCLPGTRLERAGLDATVTVVADRCADGTVAIARRGADRVLEVSASSVGEARHRGSEDPHAVPADRWVLASDADSMVPEHWLLEHLKHMSDGADAVAGHVRVDDWTERAPELAELYEAEYARRTDHVHGANLGISGAAYAELGGFRPLAVGEDQDLVDRCRGAGFRVDTCALAPVVTSARRVPRARDGFSAHLDALEPA